MTSPVYETPDAVAAAVRGVLKRAENPLDEGQPG
jgi:hypothetical protein